MLVRVLGLAMCLVHEFQGIDELPALRSYKRWLFFEAPYAFMNAATIVLFFEMV